MAIPSETITTICSHCDRAIPSPNYDLHYVHCFRNLERCLICGEMVPKRHAEEHYEKIHAPVVCSMCNESISREVFRHHIDAKCLQRVITCDFCEFPLPAIDLIKHQEVCGSRTERCQHCTKYVMLREKTDHEAHCPGTNSFEHISGETSRARDTSERRHGRRPERGANRSHKKLLFTIAITGIAFLIGSFFLQRRGESHRQQ